MQSALFVRLMRSYNVAYKCANLLSNAIYRYAVYEDLTSLDQLHRGRLSIHRQIS